MDRNYPTPSFADSLVPPPQTAAWAYERSTACIKPSSSYGVTHVESDILQRQSYASSQIPAYATHHPPGLSGVFEAGLHTAGSNATETSVMNFLPAIEPRGLQAGPATASLLPQFRTPTWQTANSTTAELFLTGALSSSGAFPSAALSSYQHPTAFPSRSYTSTPSPALLHDPTYSSTNGLLPSADPLLQIKSSPGTVPTVLAFDRLSSGLPVQSSTYRSAQESAPHLLQPQFSSLLHSALASASQQVSQPYGAPVFSGSVERALQRECSVIKHLQRPSSTQPVQEQLPAGEPHALQSYLAGEGSVTFQPEPSRQTSMPCSPARDSTLTLNGGAQQKISSHPTLQPTQTFPSSPGFSPASAAKAKDCASKMASQPPDGPAAAKVQSKRSSPETQSQSYSSPVQKQSSVIATHPLPFTSSQLPSLMSISPSQAYITSQTLPSSISQSQTFPATQTEKLPSIYKTLASFASQSDNATSGSQSLVCSPSHQQALSTVVPNEEYNAQVQGLCLGNPSQSYSSSHSQVLPSVSYYAQGQGTASSSQSYATGQSLTPSPSFSSGHSSSLPNSNSSLDYSLIQAPSSGKRDSSLLQPPQKYVLPGHSSPSSTASHTQALQNSRSSVDLKPVYGKSKADDGSFLSSKEDCGELPIQDVQALQASLETSTQMASGEVRAQNNAVYAVSKTDDRHNTQSVIRSNSRSDDQLLGIPGMEVSKNGRLVGQHGQLLNNSSARTTPDPKVTSQMQPVPYHMNNGINLDIENPNQQPGATAGGSSKQHLSPNSQDAKQHFALSSICFPDSMLLADERNILSNVDDILAATVAACGVAPQDFPKATTSEGDMAPVSNSTDSKCHFQSNEGRHDSSNFTSQHGVVATMQMNGGQLTAGFPKDEIGGHQAFTLANSHLQHSTGMMGPQQGLGEEAANVLRSPGGCDGGRETVDSRGMTLSKGHVGGSNGALVDPNGSSNMSSRTSSNFHLSGQDCSPSAFSSKGHLSHMDGGMSIKMENGLMECSADGLQRKKSRSKSSSKLMVEEDRAALRRGSQTKRQNSKGSEANSPTATEVVCVDGYQQQERFRQKIREVEEKQPEVKTGFIGSFLDFLKSGPKQNYSTPPVRTPNRTKKPLASSSRGRGPCPLAMPQFPSPQGPLMSPASHPHSTGSSSKRLDEDLHRNLQTLPSFSSDEEDTAGKNQDLQKSITSALSSLDEQSERKQKLENKGGGGVAKQGKSSGTQSSAAKSKEQQSSASLDTDELLKSVPSDKLATQLGSVAIEGLTDEELSDSGGEGMYRERDEFVVKNEDIDSLKVTLKTGLEPPAIWKVQKALLQKFIPELREGRRVFSATNSYLGYFGDAKTMYRRVYVKFIDTVNKREYVRVCSRKPRCKPMHCVRGSQGKLPTAQRMGPAAVSGGSLIRVYPRPRPRQSRPRAEPPPKKRKKWKEAFPISPSPSPCPCPCPSISSPQALSDAEEEDEIPPPMPFTVRLLNTPVLKDSFRNYVELLISVALDTELVDTLETSNDGFLLPNMKRMDGLISDTRRRFRAKLRMGQLFKTALDSLPEISVVTELKKDGEKPAFKVRLGGRTYNRKTLKPSQIPTQVPLEYTVDQHKTQWFSLYHSLRHYKYHTYLMCKDEVALLRTQPDNLRHEEMVQTCLNNRVWLEGLFERFGELLTQAQQASL